MTDVLTESRVSRWARFGATVAAIAVAWATLTNRVGNLEDAGDKTDATLKETKDKTDATLARIEGKVDSIGMTVVQNAADTRVTFADVRAQIEILKAALAAKDGR